MTHHNTRGVQAWMRAAAASFSACAAGFSPAFAAPLQEAAPPAGEWQALFNGRTLDGWTTPGDPRAWTVAEGELRVDPAGAGRGWWLRTTRQFRDFELELEFLLPPGGNSGVGLRGSTVGDPAFTGMEVQIFDSHGRPPSVQDCGAVYAALAPRTQAVKPAGQWNAYRIRLVGDTLDVWLNGEHIHQAERLDDRGYIHSPENKSPLRDRLQTGYISLQDHGDPVRFRNIRIRDLSPDPDEGGWEPIFNGRDTSGWHARGGGSWTVEHGTLVGADGPGHLFTDATYGDLEIRAHVRVNDRGNGGLYFRAVPDAKDPQSWPTGYEAQVDQHDPKNFTGCVYGRAWPEGVSEPITRDNAWFDYRVRAVGDQVQTWINGRPMVDARLTDYSNGHIALQTHHQGNRIEWTDIQARATDFGPAKSVRARAAGDRTHVAEEPAKSVARPVRLFYCTHSAGYQHEVLPETREILARLGDELDWLDVTVSNDITDLTAGRLAETDAVVFFTTGMLPMGPMRERLMQWVLDGGALIGVHSATDTFAQYEPYVRMIGGTFESHPWNEEVLIVVDDPEHPAMRPFIEGSDPPPLTRMPVPPGARDGPRAARDGRTTQTFRIADEIYQFRAINDDMHVLMSLDPSNPKTEPGRPYPLAWTREPGKGRVFYTALGHRPEVWRDDRFIKHLIEGIRWATRAAGSDKADKEPTE